MPLARWQSTITDEAGNVVPSASVEVRSEANGNLVALFTDRNGDVPKSNPFPADADGFAFFHAAGGAFRVTASQGAFLREWRFVAVGLGAESDLIFVPIGPDDPQVADLVERGDYDDEDEGFRVLVSDTGDGRAAIYTMGDGGSADWSDPAYLTGAPGNDGIGDRYDLSVTYQGRPGSGETFPRAVFTTTVTFPIDMAGSQAVAAIAADSEAVFSLQFNDVEFGTLTFASAATVGVFDAESPAEFDAGDILTIVAPSPRDDTLADIAITLTGNR